ncbi:MAG: GWxTD domain-containing protein [Candidatus Aminicenantes bacterium]|nr:GWxTD domain-containing protein [Candidatus Aminicenantes bacterium]
MRHRKAIVLGLIVLGAMAGIVNALPKDAWYTQHYFLMQDFERKAYKGLSASGRLEFQKLYWEFRSPAQKEEFDRRMAYIMPTFKNENSSQPWNTDRARIYLLNGRPAGVEQRQNDFWSGQVTPPGAQAGVVQDRTGEDIQGRTLEIWSYPFERQVVAYAFSFQPPNKWVQVQISASGGRYIQGLEKRSRIETWGPSDEDAYKAKLAALKAVK